MDPAVFICAAVIPCAFFGAATRAKYIELFSKSRLSIGGAAVLGGAFSATLGSTLSLAGVGDIICVLLMFLGSVAVVAAAATFLSEE